MRTTGRLARSQNLLNRPKVCYPYFLSTEGLATCSGWSGNSNNNNKRYFSSSLALRSPASDEDDSQQQPKQPQQPQHPMFCYQCEKVRDNTACTTQSGECGKSQDVAALQDLLMHAVKGIAMLAHRARQRGGQGFDDEDEDRFVLRALASTCTGINHDVTSLRALLSQASQMMVKARCLYEKELEREGKFDLGAGPSSRTSAKGWGIKDDLEGEEDPTSFTYDAAASVEELVKQGKAVGIQVRQQKYGADVSGLQEFILYGLKGLSVYFDNAMEFRDIDEEVVEVVYYLLDELTRESPTVEGLVDLASELGALNLRVMGELDEATIHRYGKPTPTRVNTFYVKGKCIAVSGQDLRDLELVLKQTAGQGINVYTHGELISAHGYPKLKATYPHLVGNFGSGWGNQQTDFAEFPGPIVVTSDGLLPPLDSYKDKLYTRDVITLPGVKFIGENDTFAQVVEHAKKLKGFEADESRHSYTMTGFGKDWFLSHTNVDKMVDELAKGQVKHIYVIGGSDGHTNGERNNFKDFVDGVSPDSLVFTLGDIKYRFNKQFKAFGHLGSFPRLMDVGQSHDLHSLSKIIGAISKTTKKDVKDLPLTWLHSWSDQKSISNLMSIFCIKPKQILLGPSLPPFITPTVFKALSDKYNLAVIPSVKSN